MEKSDIENLVLNSTVEKMLLEFNSFKYSNTRELSSSEIAGMIDHTILKPEAKEGDINKLCEEAKQYSFASVCVNPCFVTLCKEKLIDSSVKVCTVIGFPLGAATTEVKCFEAEQAINNGAEEIDMVINIGRLKDQDYFYVFNEIDKIAAIAGKANVICKVIIETALLNDKEKIKACILCKHAKANFVKTSTGFSKSGATIKDVSLMRFIVGDKMGVKASGGIKTREDALAMIRSGASRIGASAGISIVSGENLRTESY